MQKYKFLIYHKEYGDFLKELQALGVLHVIEKKTEINDEEHKKFQLINRINKVIKFLEKREVEKTDNCPYADGLKIIDEIIYKQKELTELQQNLASVKKEIINTEPWGDFSNEIIRKLNKHNLFLRFFTISKKKFDENLNEQQNLQVINEYNNRVYFVIIQQENEELNIDADEVKLPKNGLSEIKKKAAEIEEKILKINNDLDHYSETCIPLIKRERDAVSSTKDFLKVIENTEHAADGKMKILEGWVPSSNKEKTREFLNKNEILYIIDDATKNEKVPILLKNNRFSRLFEPIGKLFSLPSYSELDLTVFFAPFFMLFFGFCLGDAGYGLLFLLGAGFYKLKANKEIKPLLSLIQILGIATIIFGIISGTFFGINLIEADIKYLTNYKTLFLNPDNMFNLAIVLGALQIVFGITIKAINQIKQYGFKHSLATFGWLIILLGSAIYVTLTELDYIATNNNILYTILSVGGFLIVFFSDVEISIAARIGKGVWDIYSTVTGIFGDLLSYIRLFALGLSSAILGFVINDIALQILDSAPIIGPVFFVIFLLLGHGINILISSLGSFVHPMRLTFVEFYKNAGFAGGGKEYKPFSGVVEAK
ncbi:MAG: V-type ATPase 116kDa subunit family protein [Bacteroidales bacterium]|nr:V-type ATPase 116kDa subunit family protein [Bacteroidales bacterium]